MKTCTRCGGEGPFPVDRSARDGMHTQCKACHRARIAARRAAMPDADRRAVWRDEKRVEKRRDPDGVRARARAWWAKPENKARHQPQNRARSRVWYRENRDRWIAYKFTRRARKANAAGSATAEQVRARIAYFGGLCAYCSKPYEHVDHVIALSRGGTNWPANLRPACAACNLSKFTRTWACGKNA